MNSTIHRRIEAIQRGETPKGYKRCPIGVVPIDWQDYAFSDLFTVYCNYTDDLTTYPLYSLTLEEGITPKTERYERSHLVKKENAFKVMRKNDFAFNPMNVRFGAIARYKNGVNPISVSGYYDIFSIVNEDDLLFMENFITCNAMLTYYTLLATGSLIEKKRFHFSQFMNLILPLPNQKERKKIGETLAQQDRLINLKQRLIDEKRRQKKYLMQTLLTGKTRLPGFKDKWKTKTLGEIATFCSGGTPNRDRSDYFGGTIPWIKSGELNRDIITETEESITDLGLSNSSAKIIPAGTILIAMYGATAGVVAITNISAAINQAILAVKPTIPISICFLYNSIKNIMITAVNKYTQGGQPNFNSAIIKKLSISLPSLPEQEAIAEVLSTADEELSLLERELEQEKLRKKALMQLLLTGLVRVKEL